MRVGTVYPQIEFGAHLHTTPSSWREKVNAAYKGGCNRFDGAIKGYGGCPMAKDALTGNMPTEKLLDYFMEKKLNLHLDKSSFKNALNATTNVFL